MKNRTNTAIRRRDLNKLIVNYGESRGYTTDMLQCLVARGCANFLGTTKLIDITKEVPRAPGRPAGVKGMKKGTGRRSTDGWIQAELGDVAGYVELCTDVIQSRSKRGLRPSLAVAIAIIASKAPRALHEWTGTAPKWAATAWIRQNAVHTTPVFEEELKLPIDDYDTTPADEALDSSDDVVELTYEQMKEIERCILSK